MKIQDILWMQIGEFQQTGFEARTIMMTPRALQRLVEELNADGEDAMRTLAMGVGDAPVTFADKFEIVVADLPITRPICVSGTVSDMLSLYNMEVKPGQAPPPG